MEKLCFFSIVSNNYFAQVQILVASLRLIYGNDVDVKVVVVDKKSEKVDYNSANCDIIFIEDLKLPTLPYFSMKYNVVEFNTFVKPFVFLYLLENYQKVFYLDPDIEIYNKLLYATELLNAYPCVLTPHKLKFNEHADSNEMNIRGSGHFNLGFAGFNSSDTSKEILKYWGKDLEINCYNDTIHSRFTDQKEISNLYFYFAKYMYSIEDPGYNLAPWNFDERELVLENNGYYTRFKNATKLYPLTFLHFSGFNMKGEESFFTTKHQKIEIKKNSCLYNLLTQYKQKMIKTRFNEYNKIPYAFNYFDNGNYISRFERRVYEFLIENKFLLADDNPFLTNGPFYRFLKKSHLLTNNNLIKTDMTTPNALKKGDFNKKEKVLKSLMTGCKKIIGISHYVLLMKYMGYASRYEYQMFLVENKAKRFFKKED